MKDVSKYAVRGKVDRRKDISEEEERDAMRRSGVPKDRREQKRRNEEENLRRLRGRARDAIDAMEDEE